MWRATLLQAALADPWGLNRPAQVPTESSSFQELRGTQLFATVDFNLDRSSDLLFYNTTSAGTSVEALCKLGDDRGSSWNRCGSSTIPLKSEKPLFLRPFQLDNDIGYLSVEPALSNSSDEKTAVCRLVSYAPNFRDLAKSPYDYAEVWSGDCNCNFLPLFLDLNFDGLTDVLVMHGDKRVAYINKGRGGQFEKRDWTGLADSFDLEHYSARDRFPIDLGTFKTSEFYLSEDQNDASSTEMRNPVQSILDWFKSWIQDPSPKQQTLNALREHFVDFKKNALKLYSLENDQWMPRPLPLTEPSYMSAGVPGAHEIDMDGDCIPDLVFIVDSPDFQGRQELEIWLTEARDERNSSDPHDRIRRLWRSQRLLLPEGLLSVSMADLFNSAGSDLVALARGSDGETKLFTFRMLHEDQPYDALCKPFHFSYGGLNGRVEREFMAIAPIHGEVLLPHLFIRDIDGDRFDDALLVMKNPILEDNVFLRVFTSVKSANGRSTKSATEEALHLLENREGEGWQARVRNIVQSVTARVLHFFVTLGSPLSWWHRMWVSRKEKDVEFTHAFEKAYDLQLSGAFNARSSAFGWLDPSNFLAWNGELSAERPMTIFPQTGYSGETGYSTRVKVFGAQCRPVGLSGAKSESLPSRRSAFPLSGAVVTMAPPGMEGGRIPVRRSLTTIDSSYPLRPASLAIGFGDSSNYIDAVTIGVPYSREPLRDCEKTSREQRAAAPPADAFRRTWSAVMPNSELLIEVPGNRWQNNEWKLRLIVSPGRTALRVVVAMVVALVCVGMYNLVLARRLEEARRQAKVL